MNRTDCPEVEQIAAFLEGRLPPAERSQVLSHLDQCPDCFEWVCEAQRERSAEAEEETQPAEAESPPAGWGRGAPAWKWAGLAAALLVAAFYLFVGLPRRAEGELARMVDPLAAGSPLTRHFSPPISAGFAPTSGGQADFLLGAAMVDLYAAALESQPSQIQLARSQVLLALPSSSGGAETAAALQESASPSPRQVRRWDSQLEKGAGGSAYARGRWAETLRLAAEAERVDFFLDPATEGLWSDAFPSFPASVRDAIERLRNAKDPVQQRDELSHLRTELRNWIDSQRTG